MDLTKIKEVENIIGYVFNDKSLLVSALTHSSFTNEHKNCENYEKLEFLGDSILNFIIAEELFYATVKDEGEMTATRARMVSRKPLDDAVGKMNLYRYVRFGKGAEANEFVSEKKRSDIFESVLAAIYIDSKDMVEPKKFIKEHLCVDLTHITVDYKSRLQEYAQSKKLTLEYPKAVQSGVANHPYFKAQVILDGRYIGEGEGYSIKEAQQNAAKEVFSQLEKDRK